ncbi:membrane protein YqaA with SNARE-associated domain [Rhizobium rosettiformans]|uniref:Membrane protein YqaA with SNARE-associated domain n=1 Tax=Rhizobium rosettiformans TaxID=1368430 RepID=A0A7W8HLP2_9HYPH|nr:membrane protein YqaA with SNARE-associated domain [Rhizobium rosettiformans]
MITALAAYLALFLAAFLAATIVPAQSEAVLVGLILADKQPLLLLLLVATTGNALGSVVNWLLGRFIEHFRDRPWFPVSPEKLARAEAWYRRFGVWSLLLSWVPIIGDPLTVVAGVLKTPFLTFLALVTLAKAGRYIVLAVVTLGVIG